MKIAVDISLYPLTADYVPPIKDFIERLGRHPGLDLEYNALSTQARGEIDVVFDALKQEMSRTFSAPETGVFVLKVIGGLHARAPHRG